MEQENEALQEICRKIDDGTIKNRKDLSSAKRMVAIKYKLKRIVKNSDIISFYGGSVDFLQRKPTRTMSGVAIVAVMARPARCPHGKCTFCPGGPENDSPQSYTGHEPAAMRAIQNKYHPFLQTYKRIEQLRAIGHPTDKIELIIMGGTFPSQDLDYQEYFVRECLSAMNFYSSDVLASSIENCLFFPSTDASLKEARALLSKRPLLLEKAQKINEKAHNRCVGMTFETRPDWAFEPQIERMLAYGGTRVELGVQTVYDFIYSKIKRGHTTRDTKRATALLKDQGFKINYHMMPGLPGSNTGRDLRMFERIFTDPDYCPDMVKIYTCLVMEKTPLHDNYLAGDFIPYTTEQTVDFIIKAKLLMPPWVRTMRIQRDIPTTLVAAGSDKSNIGQIVQEEMKRRRISCKCIRCREMGLKVYKEGIIPREQDIKLVKRKYNASGGKEIFLSYEDTKNDAIIGFLRMRLPGEHVFRKEITDATALVRELHIYGPLAPIGSTKKTWWQHKGYGNKLLKAAEDMARENYDRDKMVIISGIGVREYYRRFDYQKDGPYVSKSLKL